MAWVVFLRGVNVGGAKVFRPSEFAKTLRGLKVTNHGAAGTFIVEGKTDAASILKQFRRKLPFKADIIICTAGELADLVKRQPFGDGARPPGITWYVTILPSRPRKLPRLPLQRPAGRWEFRLIQVIGKFALSEWRHGMEGFRYATDALEEFNLRGTTRNWNTMLAISTKLPRVSGGTG